MARPDADEISPMIIATLSRSIRRSALAEAVCGLTESSITSSILRPITPPASLISSAASFTPMTAYSPSGPRKPVSGVRCPMRMASACARTIAGMPTPARSAEPAAPLTSTRRDSLVMTVPPFEALASNDRRLLRPGCPAILRPILKQLEIFPLLPLGDLRLVARDLGVLDPQVIVDEIAAEAIGEATVVAQRAQCLLEALRQLHRLCLVGRVGRRTGIEHALHAVETGEDLRGHVEIGIGGGLADPVLQPRCRIAGAAEHTHHHAAVV